MYRKLSESTGCRRGGAREGVKATLLPSVLALVNFLAPSEAVTAEPRIYWSATGFQISHDRRLQHSDLEGGDISDLIELDDCQGACALLRVALDLVDDKIYFTEESPSDVVVRANLDGSDLETFVEDVPVVQFTGLAVDPVGGHVYFSGTAEPEPGIWRTDLTDGSDIEEVVVTTDFPKGIALDTVHGKIYWVQEGIGIRRADLDGSNVEDLIPFTVDTFDDAVAVDPLNERVYWEDSGRIMRASSDGLGAAEELVETDGVTAIVLDPVADALYWSEFGDSFEEGRIRRADLDGNGPADLIIAGESGALRPQFIAVDTRRPLPPFEYAAKIVCGLQRDREVMRLARGFYGTTVNIHNPNHGDIEFFKKLALTFPPAEQRPGDIMPLATHRLKYDEALAVDCDNLRAELFPGGFPPPFYIEGFVVIQSSDSLDVTAVYSTAALDRRGRVASHSSIDVEQIRERARREGADLEITKTATAEGSPTFQLVRYTIKVTNHGPGEATNVVVEDTLEVEVGVLVQVLEAAFSASHGGEWTLGTVTETAAEMEATLPSLPANQTATLEFVVEARVDPPQLEIRLVDTAEVTSDVADSNPQNDSVTLETVLP
jgi:hypothetical protein